jgi:RND superfamily putative drug exporter
VSREQNRDTDVRTGTLAWKVAGVLGWSRYVIITFWAAVTVASITVLPTITQARADSGVDGFVPSDSVTVDTEIRAFNQFGFPLLSRTVIVQRDPQGLPLSVQAEAVQRAVNVVQGEYPGTPLVRGALPVPNTLGLFPGSRESGTTVLTYLFTPPWAGFAEQYAAAEQLVAGTTGPSDAVVGVTGSIPARVEQGRIVEASLPLIEVATVAAIVLIIAVVFRSLIAPLVAICTAGIALLVTTRVAPLAAGAVGITVPSELEPLYVALVLGVVTDYVIFFLWALRTALARDSNRLTAARRATAEVAPIVTVAGLTVAAGTGALLVARSDLFRAFGPGMALAVFVGMVVSVTLTPALLAVLGRAALWPTAPTSRRDLDPVAPVAGSRLFAALTRRRPAVAVLAGCVLGLGLGLAAAPLRHLDLGLAFVPSLPDSNPVAAAATAARAGFSEGILSPTVVLVEGEGITSDRLALARFGQLLRDRAGVAGVVGPGLVPPQIERQGAVLSETGDAARYLLVLDDAPLGASAISTVSALRDDASRLAAAAGLDARIGFGGDTSLAEEIVSGTTSDLLRISAAALVANLLMLVIFLRALVAPVFLLASSMLALAASLGVTTYVFQTLLGQDGLTFYVPFAAAVLLVALGSDYNIFGVGQVWEAARRRPLAEAIGTAMPASTRAITAAGITLAVTFALLALVPLRPFRELALTMSIGILLDVLVVRTLLVPSLLTLFGRMSGWPGTRLQTSDGRK